MFVPPNDVNPVPPLATGNVPVISTVSDTGPELTSPLPSLCNTPAVVNFGKYNELDGLPIITLPDEVPVFIFVLKLELSFRLITPPDTVISPVTLVAPVIVAPA